MPPRAVPCCAVACCARGGGGQRQCATDLVVHQVTYIHGALGVFGEVMIPTKSMLRRVPQLCAKATDFGSSSQATVPPTPSFCDFPVSWMS